MLLLACTACKPRIMTSPRQGEVLNTDDVGFAIGKYDAQGREQGRWLYYELDSTLMECTHYRDGVEHGRYKQYDVDGKLAVSTRFVNGKRHGVQRTFYDGRLLGSRIRFKNGVRTHAKIYNREFLMD